ncbi:three-Cys-motif partner protein TcmP [Corallococcus exiguus]|uniref:three-Cys-motif partner protein TcmP n=1 Tax=Corallococcus exiguus TaxID=83462 RepID=UPI0015612555|nr:three-Cys-motif partner protein TcmP [Corallococcus exiguus]NRD62268.1 three-Cys-motif partner protein TcmP [Corallococcus exiguus]
MNVPVEYRGREQTYLKHRVLTEYLNSWAQKWASTARGLAWPPQPNREVRLWYVDCFAGPWQANNQNLEDTSVAIGLNALKQAARRWTEFNINLSAIFVEKNPTAFSKLEKFLSTQTEPVKTHPLFGAFGDHVTTIDRLLGTDPAFLFVDPTGWKGAGMSFIAPLASKPHRDVLINVMFNHINRFKDDPRHFLREQMKDFFGVNSGNIPPKLGEDELFAFYREQLRSAAKIPYIADLAIPHSTKDRTWFRLVVGGHHHAAVELFRNVEKRICGTEANTVRNEARSRETLQLGLPLELEQEDISYQRLHQTALLQATSDILQNLARKSPQKFGDLWPHILCERHITKSELAQIAFSLVKQNRISIIEQEPNPRRRSIKSEDSIELLRST